jgi:hypothetical protein
MWWPSSQRRPLSGGDGDIGAQWRHGGIREPVWEVPHDACIFDIDSGAKCKLEACRWWSPVRAMI